MSHTHLHGFGVPIVATPGHSGILGISVATLLVQTTVSRPPGFVMFVVLHFLALFGPTLSPNAGCCPGNLHLTKPLAKLGSLCGL
jgi:hypothetical protein